MQNEVQAEGVKQVAQVAHHVRDSGRDSVTHDLKCHPEPFQAVANRKKTFEWRKFDRDYRVGDTLNLREWNPITGDYTGPSIKVVVTYMISGAFGIPPDFCILAIAFPVSVGRATPTTEAKA